MTSITTMTRPAEDLEELACAIEARLFYRLTSGDHGGTVPTVSAPCGRRTNRLCWVCDRMNVTVTSTVRRQRFSSTRRGARLARHSALTQLHDWGVPLDGERSQTAALVIAELVANAVTHGRIPGRDFELRLELRDGTLHVAVADARGERRPHVRQSTDGEGGNGLRLIEALAAKWGVEDRPPGKTVWAELAA